MTTLHASSAAATAEYYAEYLTKAPGEVPGLWSGRQAIGLGLHGPVDVAALEALLSGRDPISGSPLGRELLDRLTADGRVVKAVSGFDATFSAPKSLSVWWALTGDEGLLEAHDIAVTAALQHLEQFGSTTRIRSGGGRLHPDSGGLTMATFRQTTSRADDPQIHTHAVISAKVQTPEGRWLALDARYLKRHQRMLGGLYQSVLRAELSHRYGVGWRPITNGQAEIAGVGDELLTVFSKRTAVIDHALDLKLDEFRMREGRDPSRWERAAMTREASADTRSRKSGHGAADLVARWQAEAANIGWTADLVSTAITEVASAFVAPPGVTVADVLETLTSQRSSWTRADVLQAFCDHQPPVSQHPGRRWAASLEHATDQVVGRLVDLDPPAATTLRGSDGRSVWIEPTAPRFTSEPVLAQEEAILVWAMAAQADPPTPSTTVDRTGLDVLQADAAAAVSGHERLVLVVGPAGAGKTRMLAAAANDLHAHGRVVFAVAPTAKAARTVERDTAIAADTVAKLLHEWQRTDRPALPRYQLPAGATLVVDEAGMLTTPVVHQLASLAEKQRWRVALVGDPRQLQGVGRSGMLGELCVNGRVEHLQQIHRFTHAWEAAASLQLRCGDQRALDEYEAHDRIIAGGLDEHLDRVATVWIVHHDHGRRIAVIASTNDHVEILNQAIQRARRDAGHLDPAVVTPVAGGEEVYVGDVIATRRNDRRLITSSGQPVRNRESWTVTAVNADGALTVTHHGGHGNIALPADYVRDHVRLGYAATEHGWQSDTVDTAIALVSAVTTRRGLYVAATRGRDENVLCVITDSDNIAEAHDVLETILVTDRADIPATTQRRTLAQTVQPTSQPTPVPRCAIPDWFPSALADAKRNLDEARLREAERHARSQRATGDVARADAVLADVSGHTHHQRAALHRAETGFDDARVRRNDVTRRLETAPWRQRRSLRSELHLAQRRLDLAEADLDHTRKQTRPAVERYTQAVADHRAAHRQLDICHTLDGLDNLQPSIGDHQRHLKALTAWKRWADGHDLPASTLHTVASLLTHRRGREQQLARALRDNIGEASTRPATQTTAHHDHYPTRTAGPDIGFGR